MEGGNAGWANDGQAQPKPWRPRTLGGGHWLRDLAPWNGGPGVQAMGPVGGGRRPSSPKTLTRHPWKQTPQPRSITDGLMGWELPDCSRGEVAAWQEAWNIGTRVSRPGSAQLCHLTVSPLNLDRLRRHRRHEAVFVGLLGRPERPRLSATARSIVTSIISRMLSACVGGKAELCCHHRGRLLAARVPPDAVLDPAPRLYPTGESTTCPAASRSYPPPLQTAPSGSRAGRGHLDQPGLGFPGSSFVASVVKSNLLCLLVQRDVGDISKGHLTVDRGPEVRSRGL